MELSLECIINNSSIASTVNPGGVLLDFLRRHEHLTGTKEGCREGDCGACTVLVGELHGGDVVYRSVNSCLLPLGDVQGKHVVTIEGINQPAALSPLQQPFVDEGGTQCGFCTPGFIISLTGYCLDDRRERATHHAATRVSGTDAIDAAAMDTAGTNAAAMDTAGTNAVAMDTAGTDAAAMDIAWTNAAATDAAVMDIAGTDAAATDEAAIDDAITAVDGNICRCTGHSPIRKAIRRITEFVSRHPNAGGSPLQHLVDQKILPEYFLTIASRLGELQTRTRAIALAEDSPVAIVAGGTDLYVQKAFTMHAEPVRRILSLHTAAVIVEQGDAIIIPGTTTVEDFRTSPIIGKYFPDLEQQLLQFGSTPIRHRATLAGNLANASPIGDMTCLFMALNASLTLEEGGARRTLALRKLYTGYKQLGKTPSELIAAITIAKPTPAARLSYEKVARRRYLDIASVNSAMSFDLLDGRMTNVGISAGGVGPTMLYLADTSAACSDKIMDARVFAEAWLIASGEISPISDARGSAGYKRLLLRQLLAAHIMKFFPDVVKKEAFA